MIFIVTSFMTDTTTDIKNSEQLNTNAVSNTLTFKDDCLNREPFAKKLTQAITTFYAFEDDAYVLSLNASFGSGKTTFVHMWKNYLEDQAIQCVYLNAWEQDFDDEPLMPILEALLGKLPDNQNTRNKIYTAVSAVGSSIAKQFIANTTGISFSDLAAEVKDKTKDKNGLEEGKKVFETYQFKRKALEDLRVALGDYVKTLDGKPLVIFVDELDRARPNYSVRFLETIKHVFSIQGICFVLSVDRDQLKQSVVHQYGNIDFDNYYLRFVTAEADLPDAGIDDLRRFVQSLNKKYSEKAKNLKQLFSKQEEEKGAVTKELAQICKIFELKPRQIQRLYRIFFKLISIPNEKEDKTARLDHYIQAIIIMIAISIEDPKLYEKIGKDQLLDKADICDLITKFKTSSYIYVFKFFKFVANESNQETIRAIAKTVVSESEFNYHLGELFDQMFCADSTFQHIYQRLESWDSFLNSDP
ncbi:KAP family NTPase [Candidatus Marinamargulisbacteria bacterium]|nr:KAP family NTPase [Candidatus Marinamargulisbacteria bacterium]